jgi:hypothetical protein
MGREMCGSDHINVLAPLLLKLEHHSCQISYLHFGSRSLVADIPVLAKDTTQIAMGKKDGAGSTYSN